MRFTRLLTAILSLSVSARTLAGSNCFSALQPGDIRAIKSVNDELAHVSPEAAASIIDQHLPQLTPAARLAIIADYRERMFENWLVALRNDPALSKAYIDFQNEVQRFHKARLGLLAGVGSFDQDNDRLDNAKKTLVSAIDASGVDADTKKKFKKQVYAILMDSYQFAGQRLTGATRQLEVAEFASGLVLSADLIALSFLSSGLSATAAAAVTTATGSSLAALMTGTAMSAITSASSGVGVLLIIDAGELIGQANIDKGQEDDFFCSLGDAVGRNSDEMTKEALITAVFGGFIGGGLKLGTTLITDLAAMPAAASASKEFIPAVKAQLSAAAKKVPITKVNTVIGTGFRGIRVLEAVQEGSECHKYLQQAHEAQVKGDEASARKFVALAQNAAVNAGMDTVGTLLSLTLSGQRAKLLAKTGANPPTTPADRSKLFNERMDKIWNYVTHLNLRAPVKTP